MATKARKHQPPGQRSERARKREFDQGRPSARQRGYTAKWERYRKGFLLDHKLCVSCMNDGRRVVSTVVDHVIPHKGDMVLFWDPDNHQALCKPCHDRKTATEDSGFARRLR